MDDYSEGYKNKPVRFGVVGAGDSFIRYFYPELAEMEKNGDAKLQYLTDIISESKFISRLEDVLKDPTESAARKAGATKLKKNLGSGEIKFFTTSSNQLPNDFIKQNIDALYIATPNDTHREYSEQGLNRELNILCEKPLASSVGDASDMAREAQNYNKLICMEAAHYHHKPTVLRLKDWINECVKECGPIKYIDGRIVETLSYDTKTDPSGTRTYRERLAANILNWLRGGGITRDTLGHLIGITKMLGKSCLQLNDVKLYNFDEKTFTADTAAKVDFSASGLYFEPGARVMLRAAKFHNKKEKYFDIVLGNNNKDRGFLHIDFDSNQIQYFNNTGTRISEEFTETSHKKLLENFLEAVKSENPKIIRTPFENAIEKLFITDSIYNMSLTNNNGTLWRKNRMEFYAN